MGATNYDTVEIDYEVCAAQAEELMGLSDEAEVVFKGLDELQADLQANWNIAGTNPLISAQNGAGYEEIILGVQTIKQNFDAVKDFLNFASAKMNETEEEKASLMAAAKAAMPN